MPDQKRPGPFLALLGSRKFVGSIVFSLLALVSAGGARWGFNFNAETAAIAATPWVLLGMANIFGIAIEDAASKSTGSGTTSTETVAAAAGAVTTTKVVEPAPSGKP